MELTLLVRTWGRPAAWVALASAFGVGCASKPPTLDQCLEMHAAGEFEKAAKSVAKVEVGSDPCAWFLMERGKIEQDGGLFAESLQSFDAAATAIASSSGEDAYVPTLSDAVMLRQGVLVSSLMRGDVMRAGFTADAMVEAYRRFVAEGAGVIDQLEVIEFEGRAEMELMAATIRESIASDRILVGTWFPAWIAFMANGQTENAALALRSLGWQLDELDVDLAAAMVERTEAGSLGDDVYVLFETGLAPTLHELEVDVELPGGERLALHVPMIEPRTADRGVRVVAVDGNEMFDTHPVGSVEAAAVAEFAAGLRVTLGSAMQRAVADLAEKTAAEQARLEAEALAAAEAAARAAEEEARQAAMAAESSEASDSASEDHHAAEEGDSGDATGGVEAESGEAEVHADPTDAAASNETEEVVVATETEVAVEVVPAPLVGDSGPADLRAWTSLPAWQQAAILSRPTSGRFTLIIDSGGGFEGGRATIEVPAGPVFLFIRSTASGNVVAYAVTVAAPEAPAHGETSSESGLDMGVTEDAETAEI
jgi:hypothetical protein